MPNPSDKNHSAALSAAAANAPGGGLFGNLIVIGFLLMLFGLGIRGVVSDDSRFSWGMFSRNNEYLVIAYWVYPSNQLVLHRPGNELGGKSMQVSPQTSGLVTRVTRYSPGTVRRWCESYAEFLYRHRLPEGAESVVVELSYAIEMPIDQPHDFITERICYPAAPPATSPTPLPSP